MLLDGIAHLYDSTGHLARDGHRGLWTAWLELASSTSNGFIAPGCCLISAGLFVLWKERRDVIENPGILLGFTGFVGACGLTHLREVTAL